MHQSLPTLQPLETKEAYLLDECDRECEEESGSNHFNISQHTVRGPEFYCQKHEGCSGRSNFFYTDIGSEFVRWGLYADRHLK